MTQERTAFLAEPRRRHELAALEARSREAAPRRSRGHWVIASAVAATATAAVVIVIRASGPTGPAEEWNIKGGDLLAVQMESASGAVPLGETCAAGDRLMASYATEHAYLLLLERDGAGRIQVLLPPGGTASAHLSAPRGATTQSFVLDEVPGRECFAAFFSDEPLDAARAGAALSAAADTPSLPGAVVRMQCCVKEGSR